VEEGEKKENRRPAPISLLRLPALFRGKKKQVAARATFEPEKKGRGKEQERAAPRFLYSLRKGRKEK